MLAATREAKVQKDKRAKIKNSDPKGSADCLFAQCLCFLEEAQLKGEMLQLHRSDPREFTPDYMAVSKWFQHTGTSAEKIAHEASEKRWTVMHALCVNAAAACLFYHYQTRRPQIKKTSENLQRSISSLSKGDSASPSGGTPGSGVPTATPPSVISPHGNTHGSVARSPVLKSTNPSNGTVNELRQHVTETEDLHKAFECLFTGAQLWQEVEKDPAARLPEKLNWNQVQPKQLLEYLKRWRAPSLSIF